MECGQMSCLELGHYRLRRLDSFDGFDDQPHDYQTVSAMASGMGQLTIDWLPILRKKRTVFQYNVLEALR